MLLDKSAGLRDTTKKKSVWGPFVLHQAGRPTLSITFSREFGQSIAKQTKRRSVSG